MSKHYRFFALLALVVCLQVTCSAKAVSVMNQSKESCVADIVGQTKLYVQGNPIRYAMVSGEALPVLNYQHKNYVPAQTAGEWFGKVPSWNEERLVLDFSGNAAAKIAAADQIPKLSGTALVNLVSQITVCVDGKTAVQDATILLYNNVPYVPVRMAASFCGFEVAVGRLGWAYLRTPLTEAEKSDAAAYVSAIKNLWTELDVQRYWIDTDDVTLYRREISKLMPILDRIEQLSRPDCALLEYGYSEIDESLSDIRGRIAGVEKGLATGKSMFEMQQKYISGSKIDRPNWEGIMSAGYDMERVLYQIN